MSDKNQKKKTNWKVVLFPLILALAGVAVGYGVGRFFSSPESSSHTPLEFKLLLLPLMLLAFLLVLALHELGHVLAGLAVGFDFRMYTVGPFMIEKEEGKLLFKWNKNLNTFGGLALCLPQNTENLAPKFIRFAAGGPVASLCWAMLAFGVGQALPTSPEGSFWMGTALLSAFFGLSAIFSLIIFVLTIIPMKSGGFYSDGGRILNLWKGGQQAQLEVILLQALAQSMTGTRIREIDIKPLQKALDFQVDTPFKAYIHSFLYLYFLDTHQPQEAGTHLDVYTQYLPQIPGGYQAALWLEKTYYTARYEEDADTARTYFDNAIIGAVIPKAQIFRAEAALALAEDKPKLALQKAEAAIAALPKSMDKGAAKAEAEWLEAIIQDAQKRQKYLSSTQ